MLLLQKGKTTTRRVPGSWIVSEKYDGNRAWWDGGVSRGLATVPWRNRAGIRTAAYPCTGLWSANGHPIYAPDWWLDRLPRGIILDGELWAGYGNKQKVDSVCKRLPPNMDDMGWRSIRFQVFDAPTCDEMFVSRSINIPTCKMIVRREDCVSLFAEAGATWTGGFATFGDRLGLLRDLGAIPFRPVSAYDDIEAAAGRIVADGGEGLVIRDPSRPWTPDRVPWVIKVKPRHDAEGVIMGYVSGQGKFLGMLGSILVRTCVDGRTVDLSVSGFTNEEREMNDPGWCGDHPGCECPSEVYPIDSGLQPGRVITYRYRDLTNDGVPKEASYWRPRQEG